MCAEVLAHAEVGAPTEALVCAEVLRRLHDQLGGAAADAFVTRFIGLWPVRRQRLRLAIEQRNHEQGRDAALSVCSGASMAGALRMAELGARLHARIPATAHPSAWSAAARTMDELDRLGAESVLDLARVARGMSQREPALPSRDRRRSCSPGAPATRRRAPNA